MHVRFRQFVLYDPGGHVHYAAYFTKEMAVDEVTGTSLWSRSLAVTALVAALLAPPLGALADRGGYRKLLLFLSTAVAVVSSVLT